MGSCSGRVRASALEHVAAPCSRFSGPGRTTTPPLGEELNLALASRNGTRSICSRSYTRSPCHLALPPNVVDGDSHAGEDAGCRRWRRDSVPTGSASASASPASVATRRGLRPAAYIAGSGRSGRALRAMVSVSAAAHPIVPGHSCLPLDHQHPHLHSSSAICHGSAAHEALEQTYTAAAVHEFPCRRAAETSRRPTATTVFGGTNQRARATRPHFAGDRDLTSRAEPEVEPRERPVKPRRTSQSGSTRRKTRRPASSRSRRPIRRAAA